MDLGLLATLIGALLAVVGLPFTYYMGRRTRQRPDLCYVRDFDVLMSPKDGLGGASLRLTVNDHEVKSISRTYVALFNRKGDPISGVDVVTLDPLRLSVGEDDSIQQARVVSQSRPQCGIVLAPQEDDNKTVRIDFDFFDAEDGAIIEVLHQGSNAVTVEGTVRGVTLRDKGRANLTPSAIRMVGEKTLLRRFARRVKENVLSSISVLLMPLMVLGAGIFLMSQVGFPWDKPRGPIPIDGMDLSTVEGQRQFLRAASEAGMQSASSLHPLIPLLVFVVTPVCLTIFSFWLFLHASVPKTIAADIMEEDLSDREA